MDLRVEKRRYPRAQIKWPVVVVTPDGPKEVKTRNLSLGGAFIQYSEMPDFSNPFQIVFKPFEWRSILVTAEKVWSRNFNVNGKIVFSGMGVRFTEISEDDRQFLSSAISYYLNKEQPFFKHSTRNSNPLSPVSH